MTLKYNNKINDQNWNDGENVSGGLGQGTFHFQYWANLSVLT